MHVPKTAGVALAKCLIDSLSPRILISEAFDRVLFGAFRSFETLDSSVRHRIFLDPSSLPSDADLILGHLSLATIAHVYPRANTITVLREPRSRIISHWCYWRSSPDEELATWGDWARYVSLARQPLAGFLSATDIACQVDNLFTRMLLWPNRLIPDAGFIEPDADKVLVREALVRLAHFTYVDTIENPGFLTSLQEWLSRPLSLNQINETSSPRDALKTSLHDELTANAFDLLDARSRLDRQIWLAVARSRIPSHSSEMLSERTFAKSIARYSTMLGPLGTENRGD